MKKCSDYDWFTIIDLIGPTTDVDLQLGKSG